MKETDITKIKNQFKLFTRDINTLSKIARKDSHKEIKCIMDSYMKELVYQQEIYNYQMEINKLGQSLIEMKLSIIPLSKSLEQDYQPFKTIHVYETEYLSKPSEIRNKLSRTFLDAATQKAIRDNYKNK